MRCLVTGGAGFIGSHIVDRLIDEGHEVSVVDNESADSNEEFHWRADTHNYKIDISEAPLAGGELIKIFEDCLPQAVFHLAAEARIQPSIENPIKACRVNFMGTANLLFLSEYYKAKKFIFSTTSSVYGVENLPPLKEDMKKDCLNPYSVSKSAAEDLCKVYYQIYGLKTIALRYFNVYGPRQPLRGEYAPVIGLFERQMKSGEEMIVIGDGLQTRDFTHVSDVTEANMLALSTRNEKTYGATINIGTGESVSILDLVGMFGGGYRHAPDRPGESRLTEADNSKAKEMLGWYPKISLQEYIKNLDIRKI